MGTGYLESVNYSATLDGLIIAMCKDYARRERALMTKSCSPRTMMEYKYLNIRLHEAAQEVAGEHASAYINEIGEKIGYAYSKAGAVSESTYKMRKKEVKLNIARKLHLID